MDLRGGSLARTEHRLANGGVLTDDDVERVCAEFEGGTWSGRLERVHQGPAAVSPGRARPRRGVGDRER